MVETVLAIVVILVVVITATKALVVAVVVVLLEVVLVVAVATVVARASLWAAGAAIDFVEVLTVGKRVEVLIIASNMLVGLLMDALTGVTCGVRTNFDVDVFASAMTAFRFALPET